MSVIDILTRVDSICQKYDKYDVEKHRNETSNLTGDDGFARLYASVDADIDSALEKAEAAAGEKNRAAVLAMNAEIRRTKARLMEEVPKLQRLALKKVIAEHLARQRGVADIKEMFSKLDINNTGKITLEELTSGLHKLGHQIPYPNLKILIDAVKKQIYKCLANYFSKEETVACLFNEHDVNPLLTANVWDELKRQNAEYFQAYTQRQNTVIQITEFNRLLQLQWKAVMQLNTNVASESAFSTSGRVLSDYRNRLKPEVLEMLVCTEDWLKAEDRTQGKALSSSTSGSNSPEEQQQQQQQQQQ